MQSSESSSVLTLYCLQTSHQYKHKEIIHVCIQKQKG